MVFYCTYMLAGLGIFFGIGMRRANLEGFGLILLATCLVVVTIVNTWLLGVSPMTINGYVLNSAFVVSCVVRLRTIYQGQKALNQA